MCVNECLFFHFLHSSFNVIYNKCICYSSFYPLHSEHFSIYQTSRSFVKGKIKCVPVSDGFAGVLFKELCLNNPITIMDYYY